MNPLRCLRRKWFINEFKRWVCGDNPKLKLFELQMKLKKYFLIFILLAPAILEAGSIDSVLTDVPQDADSLKPRYSDNQTFWGFSVGYFPLLDKDFESGGIATTLYSESTISKFFKFGWSLQVNIAIEGRGYLSGNGYLSHPINFGDHTLLIKGGAGLATIIYPSLVGLLEIEYFIWEFEDTAISISVSECIPGFQMLMPPVISVGILF